MAIAPIPPKGETLEDTSFRAYTEDLRLTLQTVSDDLDLAETDIDTLEATVGNFTVADITDVNLTNLLSDDLLVYEANTQTWLNKQLELNSLTDVAFDSEVGLVDGEVLKYDAVTSMWINSTLNILGTPVTIDGTATATGELRLAEDTDNGTNYVGIKAPASITTNQVWTLPTVDGSANQFLKTNGTDVLAFATPNFQTAATQTEVEAETSTTTVVTPENLQYSKRHVQVALRYEQIGSPNVIFSYGVDSVQDVGTGQYEVNFSVTFADADNYFALAPPYWNGTHIVTPYWYTNTQLTTEMECRVLDNGALFSDEETFVVFIGELA